MEKTLATRPSFANAVKQVPTADGGRFDTIFRHGTLQVEIYAPRRHDPQQPHTRDEAYVVVQESHTFLCAGRRENFVAISCSHLPTSSIASRISPTTWQCG